MKDDEWIEIFYKIKIEKHTNHDDENIFKSVNVIERVA